MKICKKMELTTVLKAIITTLLSWMSSVLFYFLPIRDLFEGLIIAFALSFILGVIYGVRHQDEGLSIKKATNALKELSIYLFIIASLFVLGERMQSDELIYQVLSAITWGMIYFYFTNLMKNLRRLFPSSNGIKYIHYILNMEFLKKFPDLKNLNDETEIKKDTQI